MVNTSFLRLIRVHALAAAGDAMVTIALAGSLFFSIDPSAARLRVALYLALTMAPFAVVGPLVGPAVDRFKGGRRSMILAINAGRAVVALLMIPNMDTLLLFPLSFAMLVLQKSYGVAKASMVPLILENDEQYVGGNARLALVGGVCGFIGAGPALLANWLGGAPLAAGFAMAVYILCVWACFSLPKVGPATRPAAADDDAFDAATAAAFEPGAFEDAAAEPDDGREQHRSSGIRRAATATGTLRGIVGFMTFLAAFALRGGTDDVDLSGVGTAFGAGVRHALQGDVASEASPAWKLGLVAAAMVCGFLTGSFLAPKLRDRLREEVIIASALAVLLTVGVLAAWGGGYVSMVVMALGVGVTASAGKLSFDSIVQRDTHDADHGRSFATFETRFQIFWVCGALIPVVIPISARIGFGVIAAAAIAAAVFFWLRQPPQPANGASNGEGRSEPATGPERQPRPV